MGRVRNVRQVPEQNLDREGEERREEEMRQGRVWGWDVNKKETRRGPFFSSGLLSPLKATNSTPYLSY